MTGRSFPLVTFFSPTASLTAFLFSLLVSPDSPTLGLAAPPSELCLVISKEQTHIKHTQGAEALIAARPVLLLVVMRDKTTHLHIFLNPFFVCFCLFF